MLLLVNGGERPSDYCQIKCLPVLKSTPIITLPAENQFAGRAIFPLYVAPFTILDPATYRAA